MKLLERLIAIAGLLIVLLLISVEINAQTGINTTHPNKNAVLDIVSSSKGILIPRLNLIATTNPSPMASHVQGMMVFNLATNNDVVPGLYLNSGSKWMKLTTNAPKVVVHASSNTAQIVPANNGIIVPVQFNTIHKSDGNFNLATETYSVPKAGYYKVESILSVNPSSTGNAYHIFATMGNFPVTFWYLVNSPLGNFNRTGSTTKFMDAGETITLNILTCQGGCKGSYTLSNANIIISHVGE